MRIPPCSLPLLAVLASLADAAVVNIDFSDLDLLGVESPTFTGLAAAPDPAGASAQWNTASAPWKDIVSADILLDSTGALTSVSLSLGVSSTFSSVIGDQELGGEGGSFVALMGDYAVLDFGKPLGGNPIGVISATGTFSGLVPSGTYDLYFYGQGDNFGTSGPSGQNTLFTLGGDSKQTRWDGFAGGDGLLLEGIEFVKFTVEADEEGRIVFTWANVVPGIGGNVTEDADGRASRYAALNAIQIVSSTPTAVPEPSIGLLGALGLLAALRRRRSA
jgi:MYXO-CTERM domain-containing protein